MNYLTKLWYWCREQYYILVNPQHKIKTYYVCGTDWQEETELVLYDTTDWLKIHQPCWEECGIVEIKVLKHQWVEK